ncbi:hypothetical protein Tco_1540279 [Tanacetum coccineum]
MGLWYPKGSGFELTAFSNSDHAGCVDTRKNTSGGIQYLELNMWPLSASLCSSHVDEDTASRLWLQLQQNTIVLRLSVSHINLMQPRAALPYQAHPYSVSFHQGTGFSILSGELGRMPTKIELTLEQSQQGVSNDVLVSIEEVEE